MEYYIEYIYDSGDSFTTHHDLCGELELTWKNYDVAVKNLERLEEHYKQYKELEDSSYTKKKRTYEQIFKDNRSKDWFVESKDVYYTEYCVKLYTDDGTVMQISCPWCGYFESLTSLEVKTKSEKRYFK
jgi:hypothetical protein